MLTGNQPIFQQLADHISNEILKGTYQEEEQIPSINEFAAYFRINPATANKGINLLVNSGLIYKKRGIGMFVASGARQLLIQAAKNDFMSSFISPLVAEAKTLGLAQEELLEAIKEEFSKEGGQL